MRRCWKWPNQILSICRQLQVQKRLEVCNVWHVHAKGYTCKTKLSFTKLDMNPSEMRHWIEGLMNGPIQSSRNSRAIRSLFRWRERQQLWLIAGHGVGVVACVWEIVKIQIPDSEVWQLEAMGVCVSWIWLLNEACGDIWHKRHKPALSIRRRFYWTSKAIWNVSKFRVLGNYFHVITEFIPDNFVRITSLFLVHFCASVYCWWLCLLGFRTITSVALSSTKL